MPSKRVSLKGKGADLFFGGDQASAPETKEMEYKTSPLQSSETPEQVQPAVARARRNQRRSTRTNGRVETPQDMSSLPDEKLEDPTESRDASKIAIFDDETIDSIRKIVKVVGRDVSFVRLSAEEKLRLAGIVYTYKVQGIKTSENEINRIAINFLLEDHESNGEHSVLARVLAALQA